jgi:CheY-like chemotaxis protein
MTRRFGGTGLGLTISARLVELMGGRVWADSPTPSHLRRCADGGPGSVFSFTVRLTAVESGAVDAAAAARVVPTGDVRDTVALRDTSALRILLAEDNPVNQKVALHMLRRGGYDVSLAENGREAVERVGRETFDLVLMDVQMPEMDGMQATRLIRQLPQAARLPIIAMTAGALDADVQECLAAGMDAHVSKPIDPDPLVRTLLTWVTVDDAAVRAAPGS